MHHEYMLLESTSVYYTRCVECIVYDSYIRFDIFFFLHELAESAGPLFPGKSAEAGQSKIVARPKKPRYASVGCEAIRRVYATATAAVAQSAMSYRFPNQYSPAPAVPCGVARP